MDVADVHRLLEDSSDYTGSPVSVGSSYGDLLELAELERENRVPHSEIETSEAQVRVIFYLVAS